MDKLQLKISYNKAIKRLAKADEYFNNTTIDIDKMASSKIIQAYNDLIKDMSNLQKEYKKLYGFEMPTHIKFNGFN